MIISRFFERIIFLGNFNQSQYMAIQNIV